MRSDTSSDQTCRNGGGWVEGAADTRSLCNKNFELLGLGRIWIEGVSRLRIMWTIDAAPDDRGRGWRVEVEHWLDAALDGCVENFRVSG
jgi:hypothetical protein